MYDPKSKNNIFFLSSITIVLLEIQSENKQEQEDKRSGDNKTQENGQTQMFFKNVIFEYIFKKKSTHLVFGAWSFLLVHIRFPPSEGPKDFVHWFFKKLDYGQSHLPWSDFIAHAVNEECDFSAPVKLIEIFEENIGIRCK